VPDETHFKSMQNYRPSTRTNSAFTLLEIMLVIIIVVALMSVLIPNLKEVLIGSKGRIAELGVNRLSGQVALYELANGAPPSTTQGLMALVEKPVGEPSPRRWQKMEEKVPVDPWNTPYQYAAPGTRSKASFDLFSASADRLANTPDDIGNWER
jgi:type II secretion system protein G